MVSSRFSFAVVCFTIAKILDCEFMSGCTQSRGVYGPRFKSIFLGFASFGSQGNDALLKKVFRTNICCGMLLLPILLLALNIVIVTKAVAVIKA